MRSAPRQPNAVSRSPSSSWAAAAANKVSVPTMMAASAGGVYLHGDGQQREGEGSRKQGNDGDIDGGGAHCRQFERLPGGGANAGQRRDHGKLQGGKAQR